MTTFDMLGQPCPLPVIKAKKALKEAAEGQSVTILVDNEIAVQNLIKLAKGLGLSSSVKANDDQKTFEATIVAGPKVASLAMEGGLVVAISRGTLGHGDETLGENLLKSFIFSLTEVEPAPEYLLFFNGGAFLTCEGSDSLKDLSELADRGVVIGTCGACLDFYGLKEKLKVGAPTNMYAIVSAMSQAKRLINV
ncbi:MAG: sulfurtransferase-like selenium metabolism protein YedF [Deltaproteobacteria bacterium]|jgi:selenium metabolism protein YedF|nr:sulfurtransferase-like selenium metabolism protein YedF [Deltaproteobacteria bacterium]